MRAKPGCGVLPDALKTHIFLRQSGLSKDKQSQVVSGAGNRYEYSPIRNSMLMLVPKVSHLRHDGVRAVSGDKYHGSKDRGHHRYRPGSREYRPRHGSRDYKSGSRGHHRTSPRTFHEHGRSSSPSMSPEVYSSSDKGQERDLSEELREEVKEIDTMMIHAKKKRAELTKAREFLSGPLLGPQE